MAGVALLLISDDRVDYLDRTLASAATALPSLDACVHVRDVDHTLGFAGAIQAGWDALAETNCSWVFHLEADFIFNAAVPVGALVDTMERNSDLAQLALKRQAWNDLELAAGGLIEANPTAHDEHGSGDSTWTSNRVCFTTNPCLYPMQLCRRGWPQVPDSEGIFTHELLFEGLRFGIWGRKFGPPWVTHIGERRTGRGY